MSKKTWACLSTRLLPAGRSSAVTVVILGIASGVLAQPASSTWNTSISFSGSGNLDMSNFGPSGNTDSDPLTISLAGTGLNTANLNGGGTFDLTSMFNTIATVGIPADGTTVGAVNASVTQPRIGLDPGLNLKAPGTTAPGNPSAPPFYGLFPPATGTVYSGSISKAQTYTFGFDGSAGDGTYTINFNGPASLTLVDSPAVVQNGNVYTFEYDDSILALNANVGGNDPVVDFTGEVDISVTAAGGAASVPDSSTSVIGALALIGICAAGAMRRNQAA